MIRSQRRGAEYDRGSKTAGTRAKINRVDPQEEHGSSSFLAGSAPKKDALADFYEH